MTDASPQVSTESGNTGTRRRRATSSGGNKRGRRNQFGSVRKLPSGKFQARYTGPDGRQHTAPMTFLTKTDANGFLATKQSEVIAGSWKPPRATKVPTFAEYAPGWLQGRTVRGKPLAPLTVRRYEQLLKDHLVPTFGPMRLDTVTTDDVEKWHSTTDAATSTRSMAYKVLATIFNSAVKAGYVDRSPCQIEGATEYKRKREIITASPDEVRQMTEAMPVHLALAIELGCWCALRIGEVIALNRSDINMAMGTVSVTKQVSVIDGQTQIVPPKSPASVRTVAIPPNVLPRLTEHLEKHTGKDKDAPLFRGLYTGERIARSQLVAQWYGAREQAGRNDLRFHDLRHTGLTIYAQQGATVADLMHRAGHSSPEMAMHYQHAVQGRDAELSERLSLVIGGNSQETTE